MILIDYKAPFFILDFPYNKGDLKLVQNLPVREWSKSAKEWRVPRLASKSLEQLGPPRTVPATWTDAAQTAKRKVEDTILKLVDFEVSRRGV